MSDTTPIFDVVILGGGPAGMAAALVAGRARLNTVVLNAESPRNQVSLASHGFLTRDGAHGLELMAIAKAQLQKYPSVRYVATTATAVTPKDGGFLVTDAQGKTRSCRRLIIATGYRDDLAAASLPGLDQVYGRSVFPCPFCDGFEHADERLAVFGGEGVEHFVPVVAMWSADLAVFTDGCPLDPSVSDELTERGVAVYERPVARLHHVDGVLTSVELDDGAQVARDAGFIATDISVPATDFGDRLGVPTTSTPWGATVLDADETGKTGVAGVYVIGDAVSGFGGLTAAAAQGSNCMENIVHEVATERWHARTAG